jgi:hypothetical protein
MDSGWTVLVVCSEGNSHVILREEWDCAIPEIRAAEAAVREAIDIAPVILIAANGLLTPAEVMALGLKPGEIRKRRP